MYEQNSHLEVTVEDLVRELDWLKGLARRLIQDPDRADDALQEAYLAALKNPPRSRAAIKNWFRTTIKRKAIDLDLQQEASLLHEVAGPDRALELQTQSELINAVLALSPENRDLILRRFWDRQNPKQMAQALKIPLETLRSRLRRALDLLRLELDRSFGDRKSWMLMLPIWALVKPSPPWIDVGARTGALFMSAKKLSVAVVLIGVVVAGVLTQEFWDEPSGKLSTTELAAQDSIHRVVQRQGQDQVDVTALVADDVLEPVSSSPTTLATERVLRGRVLEVNSELPIAGARVILRQRTEGRSSTRDPESRTDAEGSFVIRFPENRKLLSVPLEVLHPDYAKRWASRSAHIKEPENATWELQEPLYLYHGPYLSGRVLKASDRSPLSGAQILFSEDAINFFGIARAQHLTTTDEEGRFASHCRLHCQPRQALFALVAEGLGWATMEVAIGQDRVDGIEILVHEGADFDVTVLDSSGSAIPKASVLAIPYFGPIGGRPGQPRFVGLPTESRIRDLLMRTTNDLGQASFQDLPLETPWNDRKNFGEYVGDRRPYFIQVMAPGYPLFLSDLIDMAQPGARHQEFRLDALATRRVAGQVCDHDGQPLGGVDVSCDDNKFETNARGHFEFLLAAGTRSLSVKFNAVGFVAESISVPSLEPDTDTENFQMVLYPEKRSAGLVSDLKGMPVPGLILHAWHETPVPIYGRYLRLVTDKEGRFESMEMTPGPWGLQPQVPSGADFSVPSAYNFKVEGGDENIVLRIPVTQVGLVEVDVDIIDYLTGQELKPTEAMIRSIGDEARQRGIYEIFSCEGPELLARGLSAGQWRLEGKIGSRIFRHDFEILAGESVKRVTLRLGSPAQVSGRVDLRDIPLELRPKRLRLITEPTHEGQALNPAGEFDMTFSRGFFITDLEGHFGFGDVTPGATFGLRSATAGILVFGEIDIPIEGGSFVLNLKAKMGAQLEVVHDEIKEGRISFAFQREDGRFDDFLSGFLGGKADSQTLTVPAGHLAWRASYFPSRPQSEADATVTWSGVIDLEVGETKTLSLVVPHR